MVHLFGRSYSRNEVMQKVGDISQIGGIEACELTDGAARGVRALRFRTGNGFAFTVLPDRAMDIMAAEFNGQSLCWHSSTGPVSASYYEPQGDGWLRGFFGGLLTTCGLTNSGPACEDSKEQVGLHGRIAYIPAREVSWTTQWDGDECRLECCGTMRQSRVFGENLVLTRRITAWIGEGSLQIEDTVRNEGWVQSPLMVLYHINVGFPVLDDGARLVAPSQTVTPRDADAMEGMDTYDLFSGPQPNFKEQVFTHDLAAAEDGRTAAAVVNDAFGGGVGLGTYVRFRHDQLPALFEWRQMGQGSYVVGVEPSNCRSIKGRAAARAEGLLPTIAPGEERRFELEIGVLDGRAAITAFEREVEALTTELGNPPG